MLGAGPTFDESARGRLQLPPVAFAQSGRMAAGISDDAGATAELANRTFFRAPCRARRRKSGRGMRLRWRRARGGVSRRRAATPFPAQQDGRVADAFALAGAQDVFERAVKLRVALRRASRLVHTCYLGAREVAQHRPRGPATCARFLEGESGCMSGHLDRVCWGQSCRISSITGTCWAGSRC